MPYLLSSCFPILLDVNMVIGLECMNGLVREFDTVHRSATRFWKGLDWFWNVREAFDQLELVLDGPALLFGTLFGSGKSVSREDQEWLCQK